MSQISRRQLLFFFAGSTGAAILGSHVNGKEALSQSSITIARSNNLNFTPVRLPHPLEIYQTNKSYQPTGLNQGKILSPASNVKLTNYQVIDDVIVPPEYERYVIVRWGDRVFPNPEEYVGYNCDYTGFIPVSRSLDEGYLWINHEYVSFPISELAPEAPKNLAGFPTTFAAVIGMSLPKTKNTELLGEFLYNMGGTIVKISRRNPLGRYVVARDPKNRRLHGLSGLGINANRQDSRPKDNLPYKQVTSWGNRNYQQGDRNYLIGTGPAATEVFNLSTDGLKNKIIGTAYNCSGATTPWGTILSAEENFQGSAEFFVGVTEAVKPDGTQLSYTSGTTGEEFGLVGEKYGWMVEINPVNLGFRPRKHTYLGRFRHENAALRVEAGKRLVVYMGDDRRGGHTWKYVSKNKVTYPGDKANSDLLTDGTLYVAKYNPDGTGRWIPLTLDTTTNPIRPTALSSVEFAALGSAQRNGLLKLPKRSGIAGQTESGGAFNLDRANETQYIRDYRTKKLSDFYSSQGAILCDAFLAANLVGGTPTARPEDLEVHPQTKEVFIAYTDAAPGSDGYPDSRIFVVAKYSANPDENQQSGGLYKIIENSADGTGINFRWARLAQGGEAGTDNGAGFGNLDNLALDSHGNIWGVTDMSTSTHNGFDIGAAGTPTTIDHTATGNVSTFTGVFGNNWLFYIPTTGSHAGQVIPFAYGPVRCEMTGPTFVGDTLIISVQHPGEDCPINDGTLLTRNIEMLDLNGSLFNQTRTVPRGSSWPSNIPVADGGKNQSQGVPRPSVIGIRRKESKGMFF
jgi:uncharacterized protein